MTNEEAIALLKKATLFEPKLENKDYPEAFELAIKALEARSKGKWIISEIRCPNCLEYFQTDCYSTEELKKCPNCGADMRGES